MKICKNKSKVKIITHTINILICILILQINKTHANENKLKTPIKGLFKKVKLGMERKEVLNTLKKDKELEIDKSTEFGYFDKEQKYLIKAHRKPYINKIYYQFTNISKNQEKKQKEKWILYAIIINFNKKYNNYNLLYKQLANQYGESDSKTPNYSIWEGKNRAKYKSQDNREIEVNLILNSPSTIKIIDKSIKINNKTSYSKSYSFKRYQKKLNDKLLKDFKG